jgi:flagellar hook-associated protein 1 FlgK
MIKFQQGYGACSRCLTTMDEMLDKLINSTGMVGR